MFRRSDSGKAEEAGTGGLSNTGALPPELTELDDCGAPPVWTFLTALAWCRRHNWHLDGIEKGNAIWDAGSVYTGRLITAVTPEMCVQTPAAFDRAAQTGEWSLFISNIKGQTVYSTGAKVPG